jgi:predicted enzyme related to lactoylglutathione lyase
MGQPVVHFEIIGQDQKKLQSYYSELFGWTIDSTSQKNQANRSRVRSE